MARMTLLGETHDVEIVRLRPLTLRLDGRERVIADPGAPGDGPGAIMIDGRRVDFDRAGDDRDCMVRLAGRTWEVGHVDPRAEAVAGAAAADEIRAPMPGLVVSIRLRPGDPVEAGETILTIESMKLQTALNAPRAGTVAEILREEGETFERDALLVALEPEDAA